jgi:predicted permease
MTLWADVRYACRTLRKAPLFTTLTVLSVGLGIGANAIIFSLLDQIVLRPLPIERPDELVQLQIDGEFNGNTWGDGTEISYPMYRDLRDHNRVFSGLFAQFDWPIHLNAGGTTERVAGELVSGTYFPVLGIRAAAGRLITPADDRVQGAHSVAVLSFGFWQSRFAGDRAVVGRKVTINGHPFTIIGVAHEEFSGIDVGYVPQVFVPMMMKPLMTPTSNALDDRRSRFARVFGRLRRGVTPVQAEVSLQPSFQAMRREELKAKELTTASAYAKREFLRASIRVVPVPQGHSGLREGFTEPLWTLMAVVMGVLLITCANVAGLLVARGIARQREMAIRLAIGGSRARVVRQLLVESLLLAALGAVVGLFTATWGTSLLVALFERPESTIAVSSTPDARIIAFTVALALGTGLLFGLVPALQSTRPSLAPALKEQSAGIVGGGPVRLRRGLVVAQVALSLLLLIGAGLFVRSLRNLLAQNPGFDTTNLVSFATDPSLNGYPPDRNKRLAMTLVERIATEPGVTSASIAGVRVLDGGSWNSSVTVEGYAAKEGESVVAYNNTVMPGYFRTMGIPLLLGRDFTERDVRWGEPKEGEPGIAIANERFVERYLRGRNPIGQHVGFGANPGTPMPLEIVGVVGTAHYVSLRDEAEPQLFFPMLSDEHPRSFVVYVRSTRAPEALFASIRSAVHAVDANLPIYRMTTMEQQLDRSLTSERLVAGLSSALGVLATLLAVIGLYGVMAYNVARRTREVGIRMAVGAHAHRVVSLFAREAGWLIALGFVIGLPCAWAFGRYVESQLFGIEPLDPLTIGAAMIGLGTFAAAGALIPALRAARINPLSALREE